MHDEIATKADPTAQVMHLLASGGSPAADNEPLVRSWLGDRLPDDETSLRTAAGVLGLHLALGERRQSGEDLVGAITPRESVDGWSAGGSTVLQVVTDDRPFLVDTVLLALSDAGWTVRALRHPVERVSRDADGRLTASGPGVATTAESWISVEAHPPLGTSAGDALPPVLAAVREGLTASRWAHRDHAAMVGALAIAAARLADGSYAPREAERVRTSIDFLRWAGDGHFELLGYAEFAVADGVFTAVPGSGLGILHGEPECRFHPVALDDERRPVVVTQDSRRAPVHRAEYLDLISVREYDAAGALAGERRFLGLWSASAAAEPLDRIPLVAEKARQVWADLGLDAASHSGQTARLAMAALPRDEWYQRDAAELVPMVAEIVRIHERRSTRLLVWASPYGRFWWCVVFVPRDRYSTSARERISALLLERLDAESVDFRAVVNESVMARLVLVVKRADGAPPPAVDLAALEREVIAATRSWGDDFRDVAASLPAEERGVLFGEAYVAAHAPDQALADLKLANQLTDDDDLRFVLHRPRNPDDPAGLRFKVITPRTMVLSDVIPHLDALGVAIADEWPYEWSLRGRDVRLYDFGLVLPAGQTPDDWKPDDRARFADAFAASWTGRCHAGKLNRLVMTAGLTWEQVTWLRAIARYLQQAGIAYSQPYVAAALNANPELAGALVAAFEAKFDPDHEGSIDAREREFDEIVDGILTALDSVTSIDQDRILRMFVAVLKAMVRTNAFAEDRPALAFKLLPTELALLPAPRPAYEVFVCSPRVQGVHLRFGAVARGGLRWSDRAEDFRTEVLGLVKAQMVKNTVIVPVGAKGGFVPQRLPDPRVDRAAWLAEGTACYEIFVSSLLSVTDNLVDGQVVPPPRVVRHDGDDTYLVVAADKGTASFSDLANAISTGRGFWLGDAFASGGSVGYDHKGMGITARGAWESVKRLFFELGVDCQREEFTCVGIGDMAGDVFGNGMLRSEHTRLVGAFNHLHVFLDPHPDAAASYAERQRLFELPRSTWADYDHALISAGGGVWPRTAKSIPISAEVRAVLGLDEGVRQLTPNELIKAMLSAPVDLLYNGGIGTYVKASTETHAEVGDKANDAVRVDGRDVRARVSGEGGNLGWTQAGRVEYALHGAGGEGGRGNTDFIDNSAGVDTSDHEVNIKILLAPEQASGRLPADDRAALLASMTDEVAGLVLTHNIDQNVALSTEQAIGPLMTPAYEAWTRQLEALGLVDRELESLPSSAEVDARIADGVPLTRPELATLLAWTKIHLEKLINDSSLPDDPYLRSRLTTYFPKALREPFAELMASHPLRREIVTMVTVNRFVNSQGITAYTRLAEETSSGIVEIVRAQLAARRVLAIAEDERMLAHLDIDAATELGMRVELQQMVERTTRWLLNHYRGSFDIKQEADAYAGPVAAIVGMFDQAGTPEMQARVARRRSELVEAGVPEELAGKVSHARYMHLALSIAALALETGRDVGLVGRVALAITSTLGLDRVNERVNDLSRATRWDTMARAALRDDLTGLQAEIVRRALLSAPESDDPDAVVAAWAAGVGGVERAASDLAELTSETADLARMSVALRVLRTLLG